MSHSTSCSPSTGRAAKKSGAGRFLSGSARAAVFLALAVLLVGAAGCKGRGARHVILFIGDGMHLEAEIAASRYLYGADRGLAWHAFPGRYYVATWDVPTYNRYAWQKGAAKFDPAGFLPTLGYDPARGGWEPYPLQVSGIEDGYFLSPLPAYGVDDRRFGMPPAPDSAAAATAMATGWKTDAGNEAWKPGDPDDGRLETILERFRAEKGGAVGSVTTVPFDHATPAAFISHNKSRSHYYTGYRGYEGEGLADEIIRRTKPDVVIGGGHPAVNNPDFDPKKGFLSRALLEELRSSTEYVLAERRPGEDGARALEAAAASAAAAGRKLFGLFGGPGGDFDPPIPAAAPGAPRVSRPAIEDPPFKAVVSAALEVLARSPRGFFLMAEQGGVDWANHDNDYGHLVGAMADLDEAVREAAAFVDRPGDGITWKNTTLAVVADHATGFLRLNPKIVLGAGELPRQVELPLLPEPEETSPFPRGAEAPHFAYPGGEISYGTTAHTNELVALSVRGAGGAGFAAAAGRWYGGRILDNTQIYEALVEALGLRSNGGLRPKPAAGLEGR